MAQGFPSQVPRLDEADGKADCYHHGQAALTATLQMHLSSWHIGASRLDSNHWVFDDMKAYNLA